MVNNKTYFHLAAFRGSVVNGVPDTKIAGVADGILTKAASGAFLAPPNSRIRFASSGGINHSRSRINAPSFREVGFPQIAPINQTVAIPSPANLADYGPIGPTFVGTDEIIVEATHSDAAPQIQYALAWLMFQRQEPLPGKKYKIRATSTIAGVVGSWAFGAITFDQQLPPGIYEISGIDVFGTNLIGARLIFPGGGWRPGVLARNAVGSVPREEFIDGTIGAYGQFDSVAPPQGEIYVEAANAAQEWYFDITNIGVRSVY